MTIKITNIRWQGYKDNVIPPSTIIMTLESLDYKRKSKGQLKAVISTIIRKECRLIPTNFDYSKV